MVFWRKNGCRILFESTSKNILWRVVWINFTQFQFCGELFYLSWTMKQIQINFVDSVLLKVLETENVIDCWVMHMSILRLKDKMLKTQISFVPEELFEKKSVKYLDQLRLLNDTNKNFVDLTVLENENNCPSNRKLWTLLHFSTSFRLFENWKSCITG